MEKLISIGADPNQINLSNGFTALHVAAVRSTPDVLRLLLESKGSVNMFAKVRSIVFLI